MRTLLVLAVVDRGKRIDRHIDYFRSGAALAVGIPRDRPTTSPLDTKVQ